MLTEKENYLMTMRGEQPEWVPRSTFPSPGRPPATAMAMTSILQGTRNMITGGRDIWGVEFVTTRDTGGMALPKPGRFILDDIRKWRDVIKAPDLTGVDWEMMAKKDMEHIDRSQTAVSAMLNVGYFQQLCNFMGFTNGLTAMIEEPDEVIALFEYLNKFYLAVGEKVRDYYRPDVWSIADDNATAINPFFSPEMYREMIKPFHASEARIGVEMGVPVDMHDCGRCEDFIPDWLDIGVTCWNPAQLMNNLKGIKAKYGNRLVLCGCWDSSGPASWPGAAEETVRQAVRDCIDAFAPGGGFVFWADLYGPADDPEYQERVRWVTEEYDAYGRTFYQTH
ncbi:MAG: veratrol--corrinoid protein metyltransferase [Oscillospiraceae bacterium]|nr:veratrol--corrinoid protein metyltransferase [Oscillospiraceae bacterium]